MTRKKKLILFAPLALVAIAAFIAIGGEVVRLLWNWLLPSLFGLRQITFWEGIGILALSRILFGGFGGGGGRGVSRREARRRLVERAAERMSPEEREEFLARMRRRGFGQPPTGGGEPA